jgi:hypothetical protein
MKVFKVSMLLASLLFSSSQSFVSVHKVSYSLSLCYQVDTDALTCRSKAMCNSKEVNCICGQSPILIMIMYGNLVGFCGQHLPEMNFNLGYVLKEVGYDYER